MRLSLLVSIPLLFTVACTSTIPHSGTMSIEYAKVKAKSVAAKQTEAGAEVAGIRGALRERQTPATAAVSSKNVEAVAGGFPQRFVYELEVVGGKTFSVISEKGFFERADCLVVERGASLNLRRVDDALCLDEKRRQARANVAEVRATQCALAKKQLLIAQTERELSAANEQVMNLCQFSAP